jgi:signal transduction histidine kinase
MDKILQLSRIERGGELSLSSISLVPFIKRIAQTWAPEHNVEIIPSDNNISIDADEFALELIIKNLLENTRNHTTSNKITINIESALKQVKLSYHDGGTFKGDLSKLGTLFYKHNSTKGSGIGIYLSQKLLEKMDGNLSIVQKDNGLKFDLTFRKSEEVNA